MTTNHGPEYLAGLARELRNLPHETEWVEFKATWAKPEEIGEYLSAWANGATLNGKDAADLLWGIADGAHAVVGARFTPSHRQTGQRAIGELAAAWINSAHRFSFPRGNA